MNFIDSGSHKIAYEHIPGQGVGVMMLLGHKSYMSKSSKAKHIKSLCIESGVPYTAFDYAGYGQSSGETGLWLTDQWLINTMDVMDHVIKHPTILVGNSMGGFFMLMAALCRPQLVHSLVGICPGFGSYFQTTGRQEIRHGNVEIQIGFERKPIDYHFLNQKLIIDKPIRLIHGLDDELVPAKSSLNIAEKISSTDVQIHYLKGCGHSLEQPHVIPIVWRYITELRELQAV